MEATILNDTIARSPSQRARTKIRARIAVAILAAACVGAFAGPARAAFVRGDVNSDGVVNQADAVFLLNAIYIDGPEPVCWDAGDINDDGAIGLLDPVWLLTYLFVSGPAPAAPFPSAGGDPTPDGIYCTVVGVTVSSLDPYLPTGASVPFTITNSSASAVTVSIVQALATGGGQTATTFAGGVPAIVVSAGATLNTSIVTGALASLNGASDVGVAVEGQLAEEFVIYDLKVASIAFNHSTDNLGDAVEARRSRLVDILIPEYLAGVRSHEVLYVGGQLPDFKAIFQLAPADLALTFTIDALDGGDLGTIAPITVPFTGGTSGDVFITLSQPTPMIVARHDLTWNWRAGLAGSAPYSFSATTHTVYTVLGVPTSPWNPTTAGGNRQPRVDALVVLADFAADATTLQEARSQIVHAGFDLPSFRYDTVSGSSGYGTFSGSTFNFNLDMYIAQGYGGTGTVVGCCYDACSIMVCFSNLNGDALNWLASGSGFVGGFFGYLNCLDPIGLTTPYSNNPFTLSAFTRDDPICGQDSSSASSNRSGFGNHTFGGLGTGGTAVIYDLTCTFDLDANPDTTAMWPAGTTASTALAATLLTDAGEAWSTNQFVGAVLRADVHSLSPNPYINYTITANSADTISTSGGTLTQFATAGDLYEVLNLTAPQVTTEYATGWAWPTYRTNCVDNVPATGTPNPITYGFSINN
ncbi:MAG: dockerin type I repeat-containing protein [Planctomycetota bacterium]